MRYMVVRITVNTVALFVTLQLLPGLRLYHSFSGFGWGDALLSYVALGIGFWLSTALLWPIMLVLSGRIIIWTFGFFLITVNGLVFYLSHRLWGAILVDQPEWPWIAVGALLFTLTRTVLEMVTGLDSPQANHAERSHTYWQLLSTLAMGERNLFVESIRIAQLLDISVRYLKEIAVSNTRLAPIRRFCQKRIYRRQSVVIATSTAQAVRLMLQDLGPTFVKLGQIVSSRAEQLPPTWRTELEQLHSAVAPFPYTEAERILVDQLRRPPEQCFACIEPIPLAAASTAQVHRATLLDGTPVVVKVQRPDIHVTVRADLNVIRDLTQLLERRFTWAGESDINGIIREYAENIVRELDYQNEAVNGRYLAQNMSDFPEIHVPMIYSELSTARVMTQEFVKGVKITDVCALDGAGIDRADLARVFMRAIVKQVLFDGFFHGDPHPGNVLVNLETGQIIFLDLGMMGNLTNKKRLALADLIWAIQEMDGREIARGALALTTRFKAVDEEAFIQEAELLLKRYTAVGNGGISLATAMKLLFEALARAGLRLDAELTLALKAMVQAEQIVATLAPELPMVDVAFAETKRLLHQQFDTDFIVDTLRRQALRGAKEAVRRIPNLPGAIVRWLEGLQRGGFTLYIDTENVSKQIDEIDATLTRTVKWLVLSLLLVGLLISSAIASSVQTPGFQMLHMVAYTIFMGGALVAGVIVLGMVWRWLNRGEL
jgi:ubiquinone biosynthesis protein